MNLKEELKKLKNKLLAKNNNAQNNEENNERPYKVLATFEEIKEIEKQYYKEKNGKTSSGLSESFSESLNDKVDSFIKWYEKNMYEEVFDQTPEEVRYFIEKMAVWYELRYPNRSVIDMLYEDEFSYKCNHMFNENPYINKTNEELDVLLKNNPSKEIFDYLEWDKFYNTKAFINSLDEDEKNLLRKPKYFWYANYNYAYLYLTSKGTIARVSNCSFHSEKFDYKKLVGMNIKEAINILKKEDPHRDAYRIMDKIKDYDNQCKFKEGLLDCVMYRIIERGSNRISCYRAFLFAKEFNRNIDIPMQYGLGSKKNYSKEFIKEYLNAGGKEDLICYDGYFLNKTKKVNTINLKEITDIITKDELEQRLVNALASHMNSEELQQEKVKQLRLERRLDKNKK